MKWSEDCIPVGFWGKARGLNDPHYKEQSDLFLLKNF